MGRFFDDVSAREGFLLQKRKSRGGCVADLRLAKAFTDILFRTTECSSYLFHNQMAGLAPSTNVTLALVGRARLSRFPR